MSPPKRREVEVEDSESDSGEEYSGNEEGEYNGQETIQVDFEGRSPVDSDFHGIKQLLQQLFLKAHINLSELTEHIIGQNFIGSVIKQSYNDDEEPEEDDEDDPNNVFGITTVVDLTAKQHMESISQLRTLLCELSTEHASEEQNNKIQSVLNDDSKPMGLVLNERFINIPPQISVPLLETLSKELKKANEKHKFEFAYLLFICKLYKMDAASVGKKGKKKGGSLIDTDILWSNPEEEIVDAEAECRFEFCVKSDTDSGLSGSWTEDDTSMTPFRRVLLVPSEKLPVIIDKIKLSL